LIFSLPIIPQLALISGCSTGLPLEKIFVDDVPAYSKEGSCHTYSFGKLEEPSLRKVAVNR
jgi:hypothetical protein